MDHKSICNVTKCDYRQKECLSHNHIGELPGFEDYMICRLCMCNWSAEGFVKTSTKANLRSLVRDLSYLFVSLFHQQNLDICDVESHWNLLVLFLF